MKNYIGTKRIEAEPMTRGDYNKYRGWTIPADENPEDEGYIVKYSNDYISWSPKQAFEEAYSEIGENPLYDTALLMKSNDFKDRFRAELVDTLFTVINGGSQYTIPDNVQTVEKDIDLEEMEAEKEASEGNS